MDFVCINIILSEYTFYQSIITYEDKNASIAILMVSFINRQLKIFTVQIKNCSNLIWIVVYVWCIHKSEQI